MNSSRYISEWTRTNQNRSRDKSSTYTKFHLGVRWPPRLGASLCNIPQCLYCPFETWTVIFIPLFSGQLSGRAQWSALPLRFLEKVDMKKDPSLPYRRHCRANCSIRVGMEIVQCKIYIIKGALITKYFNRFMYVLLWAFCSQRNRFGGLYRSIHCNTRHQSLQSCSFHINGCWVSNGPRHVLQFRASLSLMQPRSSWWSQMINTADLARVSTNDVRIILHSAGRSLRQQFSQRILLPSSSEASTWNHKSRN